MMKFPAELRYTKEHEWAKLEDGVVTIGITDFAQEQLGDIVFVELPEVGRTLSKEESFASIESTKSVSDCYAPVSGTVVDVNKPLLDAPETINEEPYESGWLVRIKLDDEADFAELLEPAAYEAFVKETSEE
jgi:glycine cleavage system H protein